eukprot:GHVL01006598.1.p1 GENE.GHVL01006598.1~~GHVL01006598.1.p1  ORF type:complete len:237 (+),score=26.08 GHVL01006598.1:26-712(+)
MYSKELLCRGAVSSSIGIIFGIIISLIVNCTLIEISLSAFFSIYFGLLFIAAGLIILWRVLGQASDENNPRKLQLTFFAVMIVVSGVLCFILERNWFVGLSALTKLPLYTILGTSVSFALVFSAVDLLNYAIGLMQLSVVKPLVESQAQIYLVLVTAIAMGAIFGFIFGLMDVEDALKYQIRLALLREENFCYPVGAILGGLAGFGNEYIRQEEGKQYYRATEFDEDI